jgi:hypothetical protein
VPHHRSQDDHLHNDHDHDDDHRDDGKLVLCLCSV